MIKKMGENPKFKKYFPYMIMMIVTCMVGFPLFRNQIIDGHDGTFHFFRSFTTRIALADGQFIPMINPNMMGGFGYSFPIFYGALVTYIISFLSYLTGISGLAINLVILVSILLSGIFMYHFMKDKSHSQKIALLSAILYMSAPYHLYDIYTRMALGEVISFIFIPLVFHGIDSILHHENKKWWLLTIGAAGLLLTHNISTLLTAIFAFLYVLFNLKKLWNQKSLSKMVLALVFAILISSATILPLIEAKLYSDYMVFDSRYMNATAVEMNKRRIHLFEKTSYIPQIMIQGYALISVVVILYMIYRKRKYQEKIEPFSILAVLSIFLTLSIIPWHRFPSILCTVQFPWRYLLMSSFFFSIMIPIYYQKITKNWHPSFSVLLVLLALTTSIPFVRIGLHNTRVSNQIIDSNAIKKRYDIARSTGTASAEYLPRKAIYNYEYLKNRKVEPILLTGEGKLSNIQKNGTKLSFDIELSQTSEIELPYIAYPGYIIKVENQKLSSFETKNGLLGIKLPDGNYHVESYYRGSNIMMIAYTLSIISGVVFVVVIKKFQNKESV